MATLTKREQAFYGPRDKTTPGSEMWCWQTILLMQARWKQKTIDEAAFQRFVEELRQHEAWKVVPPEKPYGSLDALLQAEIGHTAQEATQILRGHGGDRKSEDFQPNNCKVEKYGNYASYHIAVLERDHPQIAAALAQGKYASVHAAAKAAGIAQTQRQVWLSTDPCKAAAALCKKYDTVYLKALIAFIQESINAE
jgi:hypothetical protein